ncbi:MAG TPA: FecR domain-containing protein [Candidatus Udaeobacter sp.]|nr:FecR domain-containing protein [Candidatus Udaeobacter sp.]
MSFTMRALPVCAALTLVAVGASAANDARIGGVIQKDFTGATGMVVGSAAKDLYYRDDVYSGETVATPGNGSTALLFQDATRLQLGANSTVVLDRFVYDPDSQQGDASIKFSKGIFRWVTGEIKNKEAVKLATPTATLVIRGTNFKLFVAGDGTSILQVFDGQVDMTPCNNGEPRSATAGQALKTTPSCGISQVGLSDVPRDPGVDGGGGGEGTGAPGGSNPEHNSAPQGGHPG